MLPSIPFHSQQQRTHAHFTLFSASRLIESHLCKQPLIFIDSMALAAFKLLKRKGGVDGISDDFSDFSLSSPATKIRRLDCGLPPIVEEDETLTVNPAPANDERALVLFKPIQHHSPSSFSLSFNSDLISQFNKSNQFPWSKQLDYNHLIGSREEEDEEDTNNNRDLAIVPWVPKVQQQQLSPPSSSSHFDDFDENNNAEFMEADEMEEGMMMDVELEQQQQQEDTVTATSTSISHHSMPMTMAEGFQQQQHCLLPHLPQNTSTPIPWTWTR